MLTNIDNTMPIRTANPHGRYFPRRHYSYWPHMIPAPAKAVTFPLQFTSSCRNPFLFPNSFLLFFFVSLIFRKAMLGFSIKKLHSVLNFFHSLLPSTQRHYPNPTSVGLQLITEDHPRCENVVESVQLEKDETRLIPSSSSSISSAGSVMESMTNYSESLGFESTDILEVHQAQLQEQQQRVHEERDDTNTLGRPRLRRRASTGGIMTDTRSEDAKNRIFPPLLPSLKPFGRPTTYMRSERKDGRLEITAYKINRPDILRATRHDGRLVLHLIQPRVQETGESSGSGWLQEPVDESVTVSVQVSVTDTEAAQESHGEEMSQASVLESVQESVNESVESVPEPVNEGVHGGVEGGEASRRRCYEVARLGYYDNRGHQVPIWSK